MPKYTDEQLQESAARIKAILADNNLTQRELADIVGTGQDQVSRWLNGKHMPGKIASKALERLEK